MDTPGISLCMIVRNEAQHLEQCLLSVQGMVSEIIIADTGSEDNSMAIAGRFGARVIRLPWEHDFSKARNHTLQLASYGWILVLDADEALADWKPEELKLLLESEHAYGYFLPFIHYVGDASGREYVTDNVCRLFRNDVRICFRGSIHEEVASSIWSLPGGHIAYARLPVHHYGYLDDELQRKNKASRNLQLIHAALRLEPDSVPLRYALGTEYYQQGQYQAAADLLLPLLEEAQPDSGYTADLYLKTAFALQAGGRPADAESVYQAGIGLYADFTDLLESYAGLLLEQGQVWRAYPLLQQALDSGDTAHKYPSSSGSGTYRTRLSAGRVCERLFLYKEAMEHYRQAIGYAPDDVTAWEQLATLCLLSGQTEQLTVFTRQLLPALPRRVLIRLVPAALNARAAPWLAALLAAPHLPEDIRQVLQVLLWTLFRDPEQPGAASAELARMQRGAPDNPWVSGYLWALSCRSGGIAAAGQGLGRLAELPPGLAAVHRRLAGQQPCPAEHRAGSNSMQEHQVASLHAETSHSRLPQCQAEEQEDPSVPAECSFPAPDIGSLADSEHRADTPLSSTDFSYAAQLLLQAGAWDTLLLLGKPFGAAHFLWSRLPLPLLQGILHAPASFRLQWCAEYTGQSQHHRLSGDAAEWLLYAAIAQSCGQAPQLTSDDEQTLLQSGSAAAITGLSYYMLLLAAEVHTEGSIAATGSIPWLLLVKSVLQGGDDGR
ncbi:glycosyltransferase [Paenibacillus silagei]|uniref:Tetratricopeptide (TPR) repeat protein n=1 Tax=Paenibacillus silagei TaxID=1670801 RepID=A0ABS4NW32_9BACL|nr:glycosyltransferase [Paenibacillus silagei]MBP2113676.1 tetratricopeptide (TPR) repeat protein [Paenibacillus silagei]